jgi:hypothetical protein
MVRRKALAIPGRSRGKVTFQKVCHLPARRVRLASSRAGFNHAGDHQEGHGCKREGLGKRQTRKTEDPLCLQAEELARDEPLKAEKEDDGHADDERWRDDG